MSQTEVCDCWVRDDESESHESWCAAVGGRKPTAQMKLSDANSVLEWASWTRLNFTESGHGRAKQYADDRATAQRITKALRVLAAWEQWNKGEGSGGLFARIEAALDDGEGT